MALPNLPVRRSVILSFVKSAVAVVTVAGKVMTGTARVRT
jgi:hypothetical protein